MAEQGDVRGIERVNYLALLALGSFYFLCASCPPTSGPNTPRAPSTCCRPSHRRPRRRRRHHARHRLRRAAQDHDEERLHPLLHPRFVAAAWLKLPVLAIAAAALAMALIDFMRKDPAPQARPTQEETEDGI
jgi:PTS system N-acetylgalactosamine-specific IIC component